MRLTIVLLFFALLQANANGNAQKVSYSGKNVSLHKIFKSIKKQTGLGFFYREDDLETGYSVTLNFKKLPLEEALKSIFYTQPLTYEVVGKTIVIKKRSLTLQDNIIINIPPPIVVKGNVSNAKGEGLKDVSVIIKGTTRGTTSDANGNFSIEAERGETLLFSIVGYVEQAIVVESERAISVSLIQDISSLQDVVIVGYGTQKRVTVTGAVTQVKGSDLEKMPTANLSNALVGRLPGITAINGNGEPGYDGSNLRIRGTNAFGNSYPLIVIDGVPDRSGGLERLNAADIESVSVLKDAAASIYGQRSANGVILITTKRGKSGKAKLSYNFNQGYSQPSVVPQMLDAVEYGNVRNEITVYKEVRDKNNNQLPGLWANALAALKSAGTYTYNNGSENKTITSPKGFAPSDLQKYADGSDPWGHPNTDWLGTVLKKWAPQQKHTLQVSGGTEAVRYAASLGYLNQDAIYHNSATGYKQYDIRFNMDVKINDYINASIGIAGREEARRSPTQNASDIFRTSLRGRPNEPAYWPNGLPAPDIENGQQPVVISTNATGYRREKKDFVQTNGKLEVKIPWVNGLKLAGIASLDKRHENYKEWKKTWLLYSWDGSSYEPDGKTPKLNAKLNPTGYTQPQLYQKNYTELAYTLSTQLSYETKIGDHAINVLVGGQKEYTNGSDFNASKKYFLSESIEQLTYGAVREQANGGGEYELARMGYYGRLNYNYKEKYLLELLGRYDGSFLFPPGNRFGFFPGVMAGWRISQEDFFRKNVKFVNNLKLRASWGQVGAEPYFGDQLAKFQYFSSYSQGTATFPSSGVSPTLYENKIGNTDFTWEKQTNINFGLDGTALNNKLNFTLEYFINKRSDALFNRNSVTPSTAGISDKLPPYNYAKLENRGWEYSVDYQGSITKDLTFTIGTNGGYAKNKIIRWNEPADVPQLKKSTGHSFGTTGSGYQVYFFDGVFATQGDIDKNILDYSSFTSKLLPGDMKIKDVSGPDGIPDGKINGDDAINTDRTRDPKFTYGFNFGLKYKGFDLTVLFQGATGGYLFVSSESGAIGNYTQWDYDHRWSIENPSTTNPRVTDRDNHNPWYRTNAENNTYYLRNTDYIRFKNTELGYTFEQSLIKKFGINGLKLYINGLNLITWDKLKIFDPEAVAGNGQYYPQSRTINFGAVVNF